MAFPLYTCETNFPDRIPEILDDLKIKVIKIENHELKDFPKAFAYSAKDRFGGVRIVGSEENGKMIVMITVDSINMLKWIPSMKLINKIEKVLLGNGLRMIDDDELP